MIYFLTRLYVKIALWFFYRELQVQGLENIPKDKPVIFTPNHQNSFMDAMLITCIVPRPIHYLVRASVFRTKIARWFLYQLNMMPIYRFRDGLKEVKKNDTIIDACTRLLQENKSLMIFPEGDHNMKYAIRPMQKGVGRIAMKSIDQYDIDVCIVPVGIYYEDHTASRSRALINIGQPINANDYYQGYKEDANLGLKILMNQVSTSMQSLTVHISPKEVYDNIYSVWQSHRTIESTIVKQYNTDQALVTQLKNNDPLDQSSNQKIKKKYRILNTLLFPLIVHGVVNHLLAYWVLHLIIRKKVSDIHFYSSIKLAVGMVLVPIFYTIQSCGLYMLGVNMFWITIYVVTLPMTGMIALRYRRYQTEID